VTDVVIMCGGRGARLRPATDSIPKALLPVGARPILDHIIDHFRRYGFHRFVLCLGYRAADIRTHFLARAGGASAVRLGVAESFMLDDGGTAMLVETGVDTATGGRLKRVAPLTIGERFVVVYADVLSDVDLTQLMAFHGRSGRLATVTAVRPRSPFGHLVLGEGDVVCDFEEKPQLDDWVNIGYAVIERPVMDRLTVDSPQLEVGLFRELATDGQLSAFRHYGSFEPMDSYADFARLNDMNRSGELAWMGGTVGLGKADW
jgi:glucose-1-phosphate cytidylyltransferase